VGIRGELSEGLAARWVLLTMLTVVIVGMVSMSSAQAEGCPNEQIRQQQIYGSRLPDCRAYEQVSPVRKNLTDAAGEAGIVQASPSGEGVSFFAVAPFPGTAGSGGQVPTYLGVRSLGGDQWLTDGLLPAAGPGSEDQVVGLTEDLGKSVVLAEEPALAPGAEPGVRNAYVEDTATGSYQLLAANIGFETFSFADATPSGPRILFETKAQLTANAVPGTYNLYEWNEAKPPDERVSLAGILPNGKAPIGGSVAGPGGPAVKVLDGREPGGSTSQYYTQNTISEDGSRIFFSDLETGIVYMREPETERTVQVSAGVEPAYWRGASPSGSFVFYTEAGGLYRWCKRVPESEPCEGEHDAGEPVTTQIADTPTDVQGTLGVSDDGLYVYFVATGKLASDKNGNGEEAEAGADNLYEWHEQATTHSVGTTFIARLLGPNPELPQDESNWRGYDAGASEGGGPSGGEKSSRVAPDGKAVLFSSVSQLTSYDNNGEIEFYLYNAERPLSSSNPVCVSCNRSGSPAFSGAHLAGASGDLTASPVARNAFLTHNLSDDGNRVFFQTEEALVPEDTDGQLDVYEWEREGAGSCVGTSASFSESDGGCLYLISTGQSAQPSYFGDASESGDDVFFFTRQPLVSQDQDLNVDVYDARVDGGIPAQNLLPPPAPCTGETSCRGASDPPPVFEAPSSATLTAEGNLTPQPPVKPKPLTRAQKFAKALKACRKQPRRRRRGCEKARRKKYGPVKKKGRK
jgi:hypothetical protein